MTLASQPSKFKWYLIQDIGPSKPKQDLWLQDHCSLDTMAIPNLAAVAGRQTTACMSKESLHLASDEVTFIIDSAVEWRIHQAVTYGYVGLQHCCLLTVRWACNKAYAVVKNHGPALTNRVGTVAMVAFTILYKNGAICNRLPYNKEAGNTLYGKKYQPKKFFDTFLGGLTPKTPPLATALL